MEEYITTKELMKVLKIKSPTTIKNWKNKGMPYIKAGKQCLYKETEVIKWLDERNEK